MILVTGATGFLGEFVLTKLGEAGVKPVCFARRTSDVSMPRKLDLVVRYGDLGDVRSLTDALQGVDTLVNLASLGTGHAPTILEACRQTGVRRGLFMSTTAIFTTLSPAGKTTRLEAEELIKRSSMRWTIIRPTMIFGTGKDRNISRLIRYLSRWPVIPILGAGDNLQQPVFVDDLAEAIIATLHRPESFCRAYNVSGREPLTYNEVVRVVARNLNRRTFMAHVPAALAVSVLKLYERLAPRPVLRAEQVMRLNEDKTFSHEEAKRDLGYNPRPFQEAVKAEIAEMRGRGIIA